METYLASIRERRRNVPVAIASAVTTTLAGAIVAAALTVGGLQIAFGLFAVLLVPLFYVASYIAEPIVFYILMASQAFEAFEVALPFATLSLSSVALLVFLAARIGGLIHARTGQLTKVVISLVLVQATAHLLQVLHVDVAIALRGMVTIGSFVGFTLAGVMVGRHRWGLQSMALGSVTAILILGVAGWAVQQGFLSAPPRAEPARTILGFTSPFIRQYGFEVQQPAIDLLFPVSVPFMMLMVRRGRLVWLVPLIAVVVVAVLFFQARSVYLQMIVMLAVITAMSGRERRSAAILGIGVLALTLGLGSQLVLESNGSQGVSSAHRSQAYSVAAQFFAEHPTAILVGSDPTYFHAFVNSQVDDLGSPIPENAPTHNVFIEELATGGIIAAGSMVIVFVLLFRRSWQRLGANSSDYGALGLAMLGGMLVEILVNPGGSNVAGLWMGLGCVAVLVDPVASAFGYEASSTEAEAFRAATAGHQSQPLLAASGGEARSHQGLERKP